MTPYGLSYIFTIKSVYSSQALPDLLDRPVTFICRMPIDVSTLGVIKNNTIEYKGKRFDFLDISSFIHIVTALLSTSQIISLIDELQSFIMKIDRPIKTKEGWNTIFQK